MKSYLNIIFSSIFFVFCITLTPAKADSNDISLSIDKVNDSEICVFINGQFFADYRADYMGTPIIWPICTPNGSLATRGWPMIDDPQMTETSNPQLQAIYQNALITERNGDKDHPHQRSMWFTHGNVSGGDFWGLTKSQIKQTNLLECRSDGKKAIIQTENVWFNDKLNLNICKDIRTIEFGVIPYPKSVRYIDFNIKIIALEDDVVFGDTKEGTFGIRMPNATTMNSKKHNSQWNGFIVNDSGQKGSEAWGKKSKWVNYWGTAAKFLTGKELQNELEKSNDSNDFPLVNIGITVFSGSNSFDTPAWQHVRDYGLFSSNPFGQHDFEINNPNADGSRRLNKGDSLFFNFRVLIHNGNLTSEDLNILYEEYTKVNIK